MGYLIACIISSALPLKQPMILVALMRLVASFLFVAASLIYLVMWSRNDLGFAFLKQLNFSKRITQGLRRSKVKDFEKNMSKPLPELDEINSLEGLSISDKSFYPDILES